MSVCGTNNHLWNTEMRTSETGHAHVVPQTPQHYNWKSLTRTLPPRPVSRSKYIHVHFILIFSNWSGVYRWAQSGSLKQGYIVLKHSYRHVLHESQCLSELIMHFHIQIRDVLWLWGTNVQHLTHYWPYPHYKNVPKKQKFIYTIIISILYCRPPTNNIVIYELMN